MSLSKNSISPINTSTTPIKLKYPATYVSDYVPETFASSSITANFGRNGDPTQNDITGSQSLIYRLVRQLYYQNYLTGSLLNTASFWDSYEQSTACSGSSEYEYRYIPTASNSQIAVICIPPKVFGEQISRNTFNLKPVIGNEYNIYDDGNGNLVDRQNSNKHIGNIIYSHGIVIITDDYYVPGFVSPLGPPDSYYTPTGPTAGYVDTTSGLYVLFTP